MFRYFLVFLFFNGSMLFSQVRDSIAIKSDSLKNIRSVEKELFQKATPINQEGHNKIFYEQMLIQEMQKSTKQLQMQTAKAIIGDRNKEDGQSKLSAKPKTDDKKAIPQDQIEDSTDRLIGPSQYDSRIEPLQLNEDIGWQKDIHTITESVGILVDIEKLNQISKTSYQLDISHKLGEVYKLCPDEAFFNQASLGVGTAFIYDKKIMLTALHVLERPLQKYVVVFGYKIINPNGLVSVFIDKDDIYYPQKVLKKNTELDVVAFSVDRNFNRPVLEWENSKTIKKEESEIYMLGYPSGLPLKLALNASILENNHPFYFYTTLDSFQGNSGSPVFNFYTNKVIGVLVSGEVDYKFNGNCNFSPLCKYPYCRGEKVIRIEEIVNQLEK